MAAQVWITLKVDEFAALRAEVDQLKADLAGWGQIWNDAVMLQARADALRDGTAQRS